MTSLLTVTLALSAAFAPTPALDVIRASNSFGLRLLAQENRDRAKDTNAILCPYSASQAWAACVVGARGKTYESLSNALGFGSSSPAYVAYAFERLNAAHATPASSFTSVNSLWLFPPTQAIKETYQSVVRRAFRSQVETVASPQEGLRKINGWVSKETSGRIPSLLQSVPRDAALAIINAALFDSAWHSPPITVNKASDLVFTAESGAKVRTKMMRFDQEMEVASAQGWRAIAIPYASLRYVFIAALPESNATVSELIGSAGPLHGDFLARFAKRKVSATIPAFNAAQEWDLVKGMKELGAKHFDGPGANFSAMSGGRLFVSDAIQKAVIGVDQTGTHAAAATAIVMTRSASMPAPAETFVFKVDRPFLYAIVDRKLSALLFVGICAKP
jgi:serine protease inhibitor